MKRILFLLIILALGGCNSHNEQAARAVCKKVSACCKTIGGVKSMATVSGDPGKDVDAFEMLNSASIIEKPTQILTW